MKTIKIIRFTDSGKEDFIGFLRDAYGERFERLDLEACEREAIDSIESDINDGNDCGQWEIGQFFTASKRPEIYRAHLGHQIEIESETPFEEE